jgi:hypothetical protein
MDRKNVWTVAGAILLGLLIMSVSLAVAQRDFRTEPRTTEGAPAHYQVVNVTEGEIIIMDVTSGDLYSAKPQDVKPYDARPRPPGSKERSRVEFKDKRDMGKKGNAPNILEFEKRKAGDGDPNFKEKADTRKDL